jgi:hypothetical protein
MSNRWKLVGLAGLAGVVARRRRATADVSPDELRDRLHERLAVVPSPAPEPPSSA